MNYLDFIKNQWDQYSLAELPALSQSAHDRLQKRRDEKIQFAKQGTAVVLEYFRNPNLVINPTDVIQELSDDVVDEDQEAVVEEIPIVPVNDGAYDWIDERLNRYFPISPAATTSTTTAPSTTPTATQYWSSSPLPASKYVYVAEQPSKKVAEKYKLVMDAFMNAGFNKVAAAALTGVAMAESGLNTKAVNTDEKDAGKKGYGIGLFQYSNDRQRAFADFIKGDHSLEKTIAFVLKEIRERPKVQQALASATSLEDAVRAVHLGYTNGSAAGFSTPEQMNSTYQPIWASMPGYPVYNYNDEHIKRLKYAQQAFMSV